MTNKVDFRFYTDSFHLIKGAKDSEGKPVMRIGGIAATEDLDSQNEILVVDGMDISRLVGGLTNWQHQAIKDPSSIIGIISKAEKRGKKVYIECDLFPDHQKAIDVYDLTRRLNNSGGKTKMSFSIEGKALERDPFDKRKVVKSIISGVAVTPTPVNGKTLAQIIKGETDGLEDPVFEKSEGNGGKKLIIDFLDKKGNRIMVDEDYNIEVEKAATTESHSAIIPESLDDEEKNQEYEQKKLSKSFLVNTESNNFKQFLSKSQIYDYILDHTSGIEGLDIIRLFKSIETITHSQGDKMSELTKEKLEKAFAILDTISEQEEEIEKGSKYDTMKACIDKGMSKQEMMKAMKSSHEDMSEEEMEKMYEKEFKKEEEEENEKVEKYDSSSLKKKIEKAEADLKDLKEQAKKEEAEIEKSEKNSDEKSQEIKKSEQTLKINDQPVEEIMKGFVDSLEEKMNEKFMAVADIMKGIVDENDSIKSLLNEKEEALKKSEEEFDKLANSANQPKSITTKSYIEKGDVVSSENNGMNINSQTVEGRKLIISKGEQLISDVGLQNGDLFEKSFAQGIDNFAFGTGGVTPEMVEKFSKAGYKIQ